MSDKLEMSHKIKKDIGPKATSLLKLINLLLNKYIIHLPFRRAESTNILKLTSSTKISRTNISSNHLV